MDESKQERRAAILRLARSRGRVCMADVRGILPYWHPETLRLDLAHLVDCGELRRKGARRGRVYVLDAASEPAYESNHLMG